MGKGDEVYSPFCVFALIVPVANASVGRNWLPALIAGLTACLLCLWLGKEGTDLPAWAAAMRLVVIVLLMASFLGKTHQSWPGKGAEYVVPLGLLILASYAVCTGAGNAIRGANMLRYGAYAVLGIMLLSAAASIRLQNVKPRADSMDMELAAVLLLPLLSGKMGCKKHLILTAAAVVTALAAAGTKENGLYGFSRGLSIDGISEHIESLTACAVTVGYYALLVYLLNAADGELRRISGKISIWSIVITGAIGYAIYLVMPRSIWLVLAGCEVLLWGILPLIWKGKKKMKKTKKGVDK